MAGRISNNIVRDGLVLYLDAANEKSYIVSGTTWGDLSKSGANGALVNGPTYNSSNGGSIVFDGVNDYVSIPYTIQNSFTNKISINIWMNAQWFDTAVNDGVTLINKNTETLTYPYVMWAAFIFPNGRYCMTVGDGINRTLVISSEVLSLNTWYNLTFTYDGTTLRLYKNGVQDASFNSATYTLGQNTVNPAIGNNPSLAPYNDWFKGNIAMTQLYNKGLSATEVLQNYNATKSRFGL